MNMLKLLMTALLSFTLITVISACDSQSPSSQKASEPAAAVPPPPPPMEDANEEGSNYEVEETTIDDTVREDFDEGADELVEPESEWEGEEGGGDGDGSQ